MRILNTNQGAIIDRSAERFSLSAIQQFLLGGVVVLAAAASLFFTNSLILLAALLGAAVVFAVVQNGVSSIFAFIVINVALTLRPHEDTIGGAPTMLDLLLGMVLAAIACYWIVRLRFLERQDLSHSLGQLLMALFVVWSVIVTSIGLFGDHTSLNNALREMLNLSPLLVLPIIYSRFVKLDSRAERWLFACVLISGLLMVGWNYFHMRSNMLRAYYLYQVKGAGLEDMLSGLLVLVATSLLMTVRSFWKTLPAMLLFLLGMLGIVICLSRTLYIAIFVCVAFVVWLGTRQERWRGIRRLIIAVCISIAVVIPIYFSSRAFRLLLVRYGLRFISSQHLGTDLSLRMRYTEWGYEWHNILQSPLLGHGFGAQFRVFDIVEHVNYWMSFSHSSYLYIIFKTGFIGASLFGGAYFSFLIKGFRLLRCGNFTVRTIIIIRASIVYLVATLICAYASPVLDSKTDLIWVGLIWGYFLVLERHLREQHASPLPILEEEWVE